MDLSFTEYSWNSGLLLCHSLFFIRLTSALPPWQSSTEHILGTSVNSIRPRHNKCEVSGTLWYNVSGESAAWWSSYWGYKLPDFGKRGRTVVQYIVINCASSSRLKILDKCTISIQNADDVVSFPNSNTLSRARQNHNCLAPTHIHGKPLCLWVLDPLTIDAHNCLGEIQGVSIIFLPTTLYSTSNPI